MLVECHERLTSKDEPEVVRDDALEEAEDYDTSSESGDDEEGKLPGVDGYADLEELRDTCDRSLIELELEEDTPKREENGKVFLI